MIAAWVLVETDKVCKHKFPYYRVSDTNVAIQVLNINIWQMH